ncbi:hypothetical protein AB6A40_005085 [Gnathostoma spinigerum]|uniref:Uncharacterized protein n=1 Tax=Gnathostoma spinigerum TaxID=75299 RepID=A0ABD6EGP5_9BILA
MVDRSSRKFGFPDLGMVVLPYYSRNLLRITQKSEENAVRFKKHQPCAHIHQRFHSTGEHFQNRNNGVLGAEYFCQSHAVVPKCAFMCSRLVMYYPEHALDIRVDICSNSQHSENTSFSTYL